METSVIQGVRQMKIDHVVKITDNISEADAVLALQSKLKKNTRIQAVAKSHDIPVYMTKTSSLLQITKAIRALMDQLADGPKDFEVEDKTRLPERTDALEEARLAIEQVVIPKGEPVELLPRPPPIIALQMELVQKYQLQWQEVGMAPNARLLILPLQDCIDDGKQAREMIDTDRQTDDNDLSDEMNGSVYNVDRLPFLPDQS